MRECVETALRWTRYELETDDGVRYAVDFYQAEDGESIIHSLVNYVSEDSKLWVGVYFDVTYYFNIGRVKVEGGEYVPYQISYPDSPFDWEESRDVD